MEKTKEKTKKKGPIKHRTTKGVQFKITKTDALLALVRSPQYIKDYEEVYFMPHDPIKEDKFLRKYEWFQRLDFGFSVDPHSSEELKQLEGQKELERSVGPLYCEDSLIDVKPHVKVKIERGKKTAQTSNLREGRYLTIEIDLGRITDNVDQTLREIKKVINNYSRYALPQPKDDTYSTAISGGASIWEIYDMLSKDGMTPSELTRKLVGENDTVNFKAGLNQITRARDKVIKLIKEAEKKIRK